MSTTASELRQAKIKYENAYAKMGQAKTERDRLIVARFEQGDSLRSIADEAGVSHQTVVNIVRRQSSATR